MATRTISEAATIDVERLRAGVRGPVILPADPGYDAARAIWNGAIGRRPACIARCRGVADVVAAVRFARERELLLAVRSGGHGIGGHAICDAGLVIDLSPMKGIRVDPAGRTARAEAEFPEHCTTRNIGRRRWPRRNGASTERSSTPATAR